MRCLHQSAPSGGTNLFLPSEMNGLDSPQVLKIVILGLVVSSDIDVNKCSGGIFLTHTNIPGNVCMLTPEDDCGRS